ncbi:uncharacterized protein LOC111076436 [Drosophila obscura]|uniref:uncharacterized protein LOC111076436 n=1 Tax=Drosophila obscura TaxID=7282 RepID=UPI001BB0EE1C|nr:uncharacterized protein LOC111076436 [Drosophila obscura]
MASILSDLHLCFSTIVGSLHFERLLPWLKMALAYFLICFIGMWSILLRSKRSRDLTDWLSSSLANLQICFVSAWGTLMRLESRRDLLFWLLRSFGYLCIWLMKRCQDALGACIDFWSKPQVRRCLYASSLTLWQDVYGMPNTGRVVLFGSWQSSRNDCWLKRAAKLIDQAKMCLDVVLLSADNARYLDCIVAAHWRGVRVRILASDKMLAANAPLMRRLCAAGVPVRCYSVGVIFSYNFAIIDSEKRALEIEATLDGVHTSLWRLRGNLIGCLKFFELGLFNHGKIIYRPNNYHYQKFFDEWNFLYPVTLPYFKAYNWI